jgi:hypothetical protein
MISWFDMRLLFPSLFLLCAIGAIAQQTQPQQNSPPPRNGAKQQQGSEKKAEESQPLPKAPVPAAENKLGPATKEQSPQKESQCILKKAFAPETWANWALFLAAFGAGVIALKTLKAIQHESEEIKSVAKAANANAQAVIEAERPWIVIEIRPGKVEMGKVNLEQFIFTAINKGRTPAEFISGDATYRFVSDPMKPAPPPPLFPSPFNRPNETLIVQGAEFDIFPSGIWPRRLVVQNRDLKGEDNLPLVLVVYGRICYRNVIDRTEHETWWCHAYNFQEDRFIATGPDGYNKHT